MSGPSEQLRQWRLQTCLTLEQVGETLEVGEGWLSRIERGGKHPSLLTAHKIQVLTGIAITAWGHEALDLTTPHGQLRHWRLSARLSLDDVGYQVGCSGGWLSRIERGDRRPSRALERELENVMTGISPGVEWIGWSG